MPRLIFKCAHLKGGGGNAAHLGYYVGYIATREGVEYVDSGRVNFPATKRQRELVERLLSDFPSCRKMFEYEDYLAAPTRGNASEFITRAMEDNYGQLTRRVDYLDYIAKRPRVQRMGEHGLFGGDDDPLVLTRVAEEVANHPGTVWLPIISLRREDAARLGYDRAEDWRALLSGYASELAASMKILPEDFRWYAAYHDEGHHPHVHMVCYSANPKAGFLTKDGIAQIKSGLVKQIFKLELTQLYAEQTQRRDTLAMESRASLSALLSGMDAGVLESGKIEALMAQLTQRLQFTAGKKQYGYLRAELKNLVDEVVDELARDERVAEAYRLWYELREEVLQSYKDNLPPRLPLSQQKEFKPIKNMVIQEALRMGERELAPREAEPLPDLAESVEEPADIALPPEEEPAPPEEMEPLPKSCVEWSDAYKNARVLLYGSDTVPRDVEAAFQMFSHEAERGNALAMCDLARMLADGLGCEVDAAASYAWYEKALAAFLAVEEKESGRYLQYRIGKLYAWGLGTPQDNSEAAKWFAMSAEEDYKYAQYSLAGLYRKGNGVEQNEAEALRLYECAAMQSFPYASFEAGKMLRDGIGAEKSETKAADYFRDAYHGFCALEQQSHDDKLQYRLGWMLLNGVGTEKDEAMARAYFEDAAELGNANAQYRLSKIILAEPNADPAEINTAVAWLEKLTEAGHSAAQYALAKLLRDGAVVEKSIPRAIALFAAAAEQGNDHAAYSLGKLYQEGTELPKDVETSVRWYTQAAEGGNQYAQYRLGKLYLLGKGVDRDKDVAIRWLTLSAAQGNQYAQYFLDHPNGYTMPLPLAATKLLHQLSNLFREREPKPPTPTMRLTDRKLLRKIKEKKVAQGHKRDDHEPAMNFY